MVWTMMALILAWEIIYDDMHVIWMMDLKSLQWIVGNRNYILFVSIQSLFNYLFGAEQGF